MNIEELLEMAIDIRKKAYSRYSNFKVGAIVVDENNNIYRGVNVENSSFGLTNCAERTAIFTGITNGMKKIKYLCVVGNAPLPISPCGACRQVMAEFSDENTIIICGNLKKEYKTFTIDELLPFKFNL